METRKTPLPFSVWLYIPFWFLCAYLFASIVVFSAAHSPSAIVSIMYFIDFGVHEASHLVFAFFPSIITAAAGSLGEMAFTVLLLVATIRRKAYMGSVLAAQWVMLGFMSAGQYMADARAQKLQLVGFGDNVKHDWHFVFSQLGWLDADTFIGNTVYGIGLLIGSAGLFYGLYFTMVKLYSRTRVNTRI